MIEGKTAIIKKQITPQGLIPEFNALGNHPENMEQYVETHVKGMYERLGIIEKYPEAKKILCVALNQLINQTPEFTGHHVPTPEMKLVSDLMMDTFLNIDKCNFSGKENFDSALNLTKEGNNVLIVQNHTSPLDTLVPLAVLRENYKQELPISIIMSQVFEYARVTNLMTSGADKFPVFQPKHIQKFEDKPEVMSKLNRQNVVALRSLSKYAEEGGKMIFLYPEKSRNSNNMGVPEPVVMGVPELLSKTNHDLYILPTFVNGLDSVFPNSPGRNELDDFFEIIKVGQGDFSCGKPIKYSKIITFVDSLPENECDDLIEKIIGEVSKDDKLKRKAVLAIVFLGLISKLAPEEKSKGIYGDNSVENLIEQLRVYNPE